MLRSKFIAPAVALTLLACVANAADNNALLDLLVKKKVISANEADAVRADLEKEAAAAAVAADKVKVGSWVEEMKIGGDLRLRYQYDHRDFQVDPPEVGARGANLDKDRSPSGAQRSRWRFRLRVRDEFKLVNNWFGGVELSTSAAADSGNQTFENGFGKYGIFISRAYLGWNATDWLTLVGGKQPNPFYTTDLVWDPDINPDGFVQTVRFHKLFSTASEGGGYSKDGKTFVPAKQAERPWELTLNMGEFIFDDNLESGNLAGAAEPGLRDNDVADDAWLFQAQLVASYKFANHVKLTIAPGAMFTNAARLSFPAGTNENQFSDVAATVLPNGDLSFVGETRKEVILLAPGDVSLKLGALPAKLYWDFAYNTQGKGREEDVYRVLRAIPPPAGAPAGAPVRFESLHETEDDIAWLVGFQLGDNKKKGDWAFNANYRHVGLTSVEPNINDSDFALGELNTRGFKVGLFYNLTDFATFGATYYYAWNLRDNLVGGQAAFLNGGVADANNVHVLQVDLNVKF
jgi:Putative porin